MEDEMKQQIELFTNSNSLPKIDLRVVLPGSIRKTTLIELSSPEEQNEIEKCLSKIEPDTPFKFYGLCSKIFKDIPTIKRVTKEILEDYRKHNVIYMELVTNLLEKKNIFTKEEFLLSILEEIKIANDNSDKFNSRLVISLNARSDITEYEEILKIYNNFQNQELKKLIVGIDYSGDVTSGNFREKKYEDIIPIFEKFRNLGLGISIHLGQNPNYQNFPLNLFAPDRVSHCVFLKDDDINNLIKKNIHIEICPSYSFKVNKCIYYEEIILKKFWNKKYVNENGEESLFNNISLNSDSRTLLLTDISQEYYEIGLSFKMGINELKKIIFNEIEYIFDKDEKLRDRLKTILNKFNI